MGRGSTRNGDGYRSPGSLNVKILTERHSEQQGVRRFVGQRLGHGQPIMDLVGIANHRTPKENGSRTAENIGARTAGRQHDLVAEGVDLGRKIRTCPLQKATSLADEASHALDLRKGSGLQVERQAGVRIDDAAIARRIVGAEIGVLEGHHRARFGSIEVDRQHVARTRAKFRMVVPYRCLNQIVIAGPKLRRRASQARYRRAERIEIAIDLDPCLGGLSSNGLQAFAELLADPGIDRACPLGIRSKRISSFGIHGRLRTLPVSGQASS